MQIHGGAAPRCSSSTIFIADFVHKDGHSEKHRFTIMVLSTLSEPRKRSLTRAKAVFEGRISKLNQRENSLAFAQLIGPCDTKEVRTLQNRDAWKIDLHQTVREVASAQLRPDAYAKEHRRYLEMPIPPGRSFHLATRQEDLK